MNAGLFMRLITNHIIEKNTYDRTKIFCTIILIEQNFHYTFFGNIVAY